ncbi:MAG: acyl-CoA synthetase FdrA, partial [Eubacterium sp.]
MLKTIIKKGSYQDSVVLMLLTNKLSSLTGVNKVSIMMATPANKDIFKASGLETPELLAAGPNDMAIVVDTEDEAIMDSILTETDTFIKNQSAPQGTGGGEEIVDSWDKALGKLPDANLAVISIPGIYAAAEADRALDEGLSVFMFSDNVTIEDEAALKQKAHERGLLVMGPDCGTGIIQGVPIAFTNHVAPGRIGIVGASGTGIQELTTIIDRLGEGVTNAIGTGGRDLSLKIGGITMLDAIDAMEEDQDTDVIIVISKPPAKEIRDRVVERLKRFSKPVVSLFLGENPEIHELGFYHAYTLDEAARIAVALVRGEDIVAGNSAISAEDAFKLEDKKSIKGYYSGGTLAAEAAMLIKDTLGLETALSKEEGFMLNTENHIIIDLGDDVYTQGKPHPMIDPAKRIECMRDAADDATTGVILFDIVLGYGSHENMAGALLPAIEVLKEKAASEGRHLYFVTT